MTTTSCLILSISLKFRASSNDCIRSEVNWILIFRGSSLLRTGNGVLPAGNSGSGSSSRIISMADEEGVLESEVIAVCTGGRLWTEDDLLCPLPGESL